MSDQPSGPGIAVALRRVVVGYRMVAALWVWLLIAVIVVTEPGIPLVGVLGVGALATIWALVTLSTAARAPAVLRSVPWIVADVVVSAGMIALDWYAAARRTSFGGYPFSTVLLAGYGAGYPGALLTAAVLSVVSFVFLGAFEAVGSMLVYLAGGGVLVWGLQVLRRNDAQRRSLEQRLAAEEAERARSQERADTAAALHDSVLQTLALIQRRSGDPDEVGNLARRQERDLRDWLGGRGRLGGASEATVAAAVADAAADIERLYPLTVDVVTVGDAPLTERLEALVAASREALANVARHAGVDRASLYAEVTDDAVQVFVRDRGSGFDPAAVPADRRGISESIVGRMQRHGGTAAIRSTPGAGTEVELRVPVV